MRWKEVEEQANKCFDSITTDVLALHQSATIGKLQKVEIMGSVIQLLIFEMTLGKTPACNSHLNAAFALFEEIMARSGQTHRNEGQLRLMSVLLEIGQPLWTKASSCRRIWSAEQAGFRFCAGLLVFIDIVASTALQERPRLYKHYFNILPQQMENLL